MQLCISKKKKKQQLVFMYLFYVHVSSIYLELI